MNHLTYMSKVMKTKRKSRSFPSASSGVEAFQVKELPRIEQITAENLQHLMDFWNDFFNG